ncbi:MAG: murein L,D-transpeptidase catalytic domain family protein [Ferruginibacter sp.]|nr:murein L,D-transpeptidase catalytic domain family protein [Chitinophagaceae bacterium]
MKTNGLLHARALNGIIFLIGTLLTVVPAFSQSKYSSQKSASLTGVNKKFFVNLTDEYFEILPVRRKLHVAAAAAALSSEEAVKIEIGNPDAGTLTTNKNIYVAENKENPRIRFTPTAFAYPKNTKSDVGIAYYPPSKLILYAKVLKEYAKKNGFDTNYVFLSNMGMLSNTKRFFVINLGTMRIEQAGLVAHGRGQGASIFEKQYSNQPGSKSTSLGRYKISGKYKGSYGMSYRMIGLDSSNKNAYRRSIVLHSMSCIPDNDGTMPACVSEGCPAISTTFLSSLRKIIDSRKKPVLLWIFDSNLEEAWVEERAQKEKFSGVDTASEEFPACSNDLPR